MARRPPASCALFANIPNRTSNPCPQGEVEMRPLHAFSQRRTINNRQRTQAPNKSYTSKLINDNYNL